MREWGINAPSRVGRTQRLKILSVTGGFSGRGRFLRPPSPSLAANKARLHFEGMSLSDPIPAGSLKVNNRHRVSHSSEWVQPFSSQQSLENAQPVPLEVSAQSAR